MWSENHFLIGEFVAEGALWSADEWPDAIWGGCFRNLAGIFGIDNCSIQTIQVYPADYWLPWSDEVWSEHDWLELLRLTRIRPQTLLASLLCATVFDWSLQPLWPDALWPDQGWRNLHAWGKPCLFQTCQYLDSQIGEYEFNYKTWAEERWPDKFWQDSWWLKKSENISADPFVAACCVTIATVFPEGFLQTWPHAGWQDDVWDDSYRQIRPEIKTSQACAYGTAANSESTQPDWPDRAWLSEVWFTPRAVGSKTRFTIYSEILPEPGWLDEPWPACIWQSSPVEDA